MVSNFTEDQNLKKTATTFIKSLWVFQSRKFKAFWSLQQDLILNRFFESMSKARLLQAYGKDVLRRGKHILY